MRNCGCSEHKPIKQIGDVIPKPDFNHGEFHHKHPKMPTDQIINHEYFDGYNDLEKQLIIENLGLSTGIAKVENYPDEEDLTSQEQDNLKVLKFKNKEYNPDIWSGYGRVFLRKNIAKQDNPCDPKVNLLTQGMFKDKNGILMDHNIFIVQYDYDLNGDFIQIPDNSIILFLGGSFNNGTIVLGTDDLFLPFGLDLDTFVSTNIRGNFKNGQVLYKCGELTAYINDKWYNLVPDVDIDALKTTIKDLTSRIEVLEKNAGIVSFTPDSIVSSSVDKYTLGILNVDGHTTPIIGKDNNQSIQSVEIVEE